jgi:hypothetical protein
MRKLVLSVAVATFWLAAPLAVHAAPAPSTTVVLSCDHNANAAATVELRADISSPPFDVVDLSCGPDSESGSKNDRVKVTTGAAGFITGLITLQNINGAGGCGVGSIVPTKLVCEAVPGPNVSLTVR